MKQYHRVFAEINIDYIEDNLKAIKDYVGHNKEVMVVIKADGYGHGAIPIARQLYEAGINCIGVATIQEAIALRKYDIDIPIVVLGYSPVEEYENLVEYDIIQTVYKYSMAKGISDAATKAGKNAKIHIKIDTGMMRIGFFPDQATVDTIIKMHTLPNLEIEGIFTHFAQADGEDRSFTNDQIELFNCFISKLEENAITIPKIHASNSAGMIEYKNAHFDIVRAGIALYGLYPSSTIDHTKLILKPSLSLKSNIIFLKEVGEGVPISYGGTYTTSKRCKIATIPVGYGDGYPRSLSSKGRVLIRGQYAPIIGRICMDQFMVDVTDIKEVCEGDEAVLIGMQGESEISVEEIAELDGTINYEIVCQLGKRIPRVYYKNNQIIYTIDYF
ncbi:MAG: alanine racemase [Firmicutes bacterium HGW-Firmicutes-1]|jgi:alanine racemase|nr:MAG: alanine racemase [Firmicutes bacterium HGW-Firmicutes-1]